LWLGHESLETTLRDLADAELGNEKTRTLVNGSFAEIDQEKKDRIPRPLLNS
jgi:hypothetical protein